MEILKTIKTTRAIIVLAAAVALSSCFKEMEPEFYAPSVLCMNATIHPDEALKVYISHTFRYSDYPDDYFSKFDYSVPDVAVSLTVNGKPVEALSHVAPTPEEEFYTLSRYGYYSGDYIPAPGDTILLRASSPSYGDAEATVVVPQYPVVGTPRTEIKADKVIVDNSEPDFLTMECGLELTVNLPVGTAKPSPNYLELDYTTFPARSNDYGVPEVWFKGLDAYGDPIFRQSESILESVLGAEPLGKALFTDRLFTGGSYDLRLRFPDGGFAVAASAPYDDSFDCGLEIMVYAVSESYYNWQLNYWQLNESISSMMSDIGMAQAPGAYSNVSTGAGVVMAKAGTPVTINLSEFLKESAGLR